MVIVCFLGDEESPGDRWLMKPEPGTGKCRVSEPGMKYRAGKFINAAQARRHLARTFHEKRYLSDDRILINEGFARRYKTIYIIEVESETIPCQPSPEPCPASCESAD